MYLAQQSIAIWKDSKSEKLVQMENKLFPLTAYLEKQRRFAVLKYKIIEPYLKKKKTLIAITAETGITKRTLQYWIENYEQLGLQVLIRKARNDTGSKIHVASEVIVTIK